MIHFDTQHYEYQTDSLKDGISLTLKEEEEKRLDILSIWKSGTLALPRLHKIAAAINCIREKLFLLGLIFSNFF